MLIDDFMPGFDFCEKHEIEVFEPAERVFASMRTCDLCESAIIRLLFRLRGLPAKNLTLDRMQKLKFCLLGETQSQEILLGLAGKFWTPTGNMQKVDAESFREFNEPGFAKAAWNFSLQEAGADRTLLMTETRIRTPDAKSRSKFALYWTIVAPFSGLIRREMLRIIKQKAESAASAEQMAIG